MNRSNDAGSTLDAAASLDTVFAPVRSQTAFEEAVDRIGTAIRLGLLPPGTRLPAERELCAKLGIARSTLRQALVALGQSGHLRAIRGRGGGTFVVDELPPAPPPPADADRRAGGRCGITASRCEVGVAVLACARARPAALDALGELVTAMEQSAGGLRHLPPARRALPPRDWPRRPATHGSSRSPPRCRATRPG